MSDTDKWYISGPLGVGAAEPQQMLDVKGNVAITAYPGRLMIGGTTTEYCVLKAEQGVLTVNEGNWANVVIPSGNVGIGKTDPDRTLDITGPLRASGEIQTTATNAFRMVQGNYGSFLRNDGADTWFLLTNAGDQYGNYNNLRPLRVNNVSGDVWLGDGNFYVRASDGSVSIGTTPANQKLEVNGNIAITAYPGRFMMGGTTNEYCALKAEQGVITINEGNWAKVVIPSGNVGIGTTEPKAKLDVKGDTLIGGPLYLQSHRTRLLGFDGRPGWHWIQTQDDENKMWIGFRQDGNGNPEWLEVGPPIRGRFWTNSDVRLKDNIVQLTNVLDKFEALRGVQFEWKDKKSSGCVAGRRDIGVIAQEVEAAFPELVVTSGTEGYKAVNYTGLIGAIIEAIKALRTETIVLRQELNALTTSR